MIPFNIPPYVGNEIKYIKEAIEKHKICGDGDFTKLWQNHLEPLLKEYLRGMENSGKILKELEEAYDFPKTSSPEDNSYSDENKE